VNDAIYAMTVALGEQRAIAIDALEKLEARYDHRAELSARCHELEQELTAALGRAARAEMELERQQLINRMLERALQDLTKPTDEGRAE